MLRRTACVRACGLQAAAALNVLTHAVGMCACDGCLQAALPQPLGGLAATVFYLDTEGKFSSDVSVLFA